MEENILDRLKPALESRYAFERELGRGGMAVVYLAQDLKHGRKVALKVLLPQVALAIGGERFQREITIAAKLTHPHILPLYDSGEADGLLYYVMPFMRGESLRERINKVKQLAVDEAVRIGVEVASALERAHADGVIHRDIKPENILLEGGFALVADFGIARAVEDSSITSTGLAVGTPTYMSPEQTAGSKVDGRSDLYSLGCVVFEMLTGRPPYRGSSMREVLSRHALDQVPSVRTTREDVPEHVDAAIAKSLAKEPDERFAGVRDFAVALSAPVAATAPAASESGIWGKLRSAFLKPSAPSTPVPSQAFPKAPVTPTQSPPSSPTHRTISPLGVPTPLVTTPSGRQPIDSLAVLPLSIMSGDADSEYLSEGITESIMNKLSSLSGLRVVPRSVVFRYKGRDIDPTVIGREVNARAVVTGRIMQRGDMIIIKAELVDTVSEAQLWGEQYHRKMSDIFAVQEEMAAEITRSLRLKISGEEEKGLAKRFTDNTEAYQAYLRGRHHWNKRTVDGLKHALSHFQEAIDLDPSYALAYTGLADTYNILGYYNNQRPHDAYPRGKAAAQRALEIDETLAEAHASMGYVQVFYDLDWAGAKKSFQRAIEINPKYATAHHWCAWYYFMVERFGEALTELRRAQELDPLSLIINDHLGYAMLLAGKPTDALRQLEKTRDLDPSFPWTYWRLGAVYYSLGRFDDAVDALKIVVDKTSGGVGLGYLAHAQAAAGRKRDAEQTLARLDERAEGCYVSPLEYALAYAGLGRVEDTVAALERAYADRVSDFARLRLLPWPDPVKAHPRFRALSDTLGSVGLSS